MTMFTLIFCGWTSITLSRTMMEMWYTMCYRGVTSGIQDMLRRGFKSVCMHAQHLHI